MKIAITSQGSELSSELDSRFGRAQKFIIFDNDTKEFAAIGNDQNLNAAQGAGIQAAQNIINTGVEVLITGHCGPKAFKTLSAGDVKVFYSDGSSIADNIEKYNNGKLKSADSADVEAHWV